MNIRECKNRDPSKSDTQFSASSICVYCSPTKHLGTGLRDEYTIYKVGVVLGYTELTFSFLLHYLLC